MKEKAHDELQLRPMKKAIHFFGKHNTQKKTTQRFFSLFA